MELKHNFPFALSAFNEVLIVPYGIETSIKPLFRLYFDVLIVPYGIET